MFAIVSIASLCYFPLLSQSESFVSTFNPQLGYKLQMYFMPTDQYYKTTISVQQIIFQSAGLLFTVCVFLVWFKFSKDIFSEYDKQYFRIFILYFCIVAGFFPSNVTFSRMVPVVFVMIMIPFSRIYSDYLSLNKIQYFHLASVPNSFIMHFGFVISMLFIVLSLALRSFVSYQEFYVLFSN